MTLHLPLPQPLWKTVPAPAQAALLDAFSQLHQEIAHLKRQLAHLQQVLNQHSTNSSRPPSADPSTVKRAPPRPPSGRRSGGQPGHPQQQRPLLEPTQPPIPLKPPACRRCGRALTGTDPQPLRHQVIELPEIRPLVIEYQRHRLLCACGTSTCGALPPGVPSGQAGPRLIAFAGLLMACFRQSKRRSAQFLSMILNQPASASWMVLLQGRAAEAVGPAYDELAGALVTQAAMNVDESPTKEGQA